MTYVGRAVAALGALDGPLVLWHTGGWLGLSARRWECRTDEPAPHLPDPRPAPELIGAGFAYESQGAAMLHDGLNLADLAHVLDLLDRGIITDPTGGGPAAGRARLLLDRRHRLRPAGRRALQLPRAGLRIAHRPAGRMAPRRPSPAGGDPSRLPSPPPSSHRPRRARRRRAGAAAGARAEHRDTLFADQTYLQQAQPSTIGHYLLRSPTRWCATGTASSMYRLAQREPRRRGCVNGTRLLGDRTAMALAWVSTT